MWWHWCDWWRAGGCGGIGVTGGGQVGVVALV